VKKSRTYLVKYYNILVYSVNQLVVLKSFIYAISAYHH
jgi:hypothetical protein